MFYRQPSYSWKISTCMHFSNCLHFSIEITFIELGLSFIPSTSLYHPPGYAWTSDWRFVKVTLVKTCWENLFGILSPRWTEPVAGAVHRGMRFLANAKHGVEQKSNLWERIFPLWTFDMQKRLCLVRPIGDNFIVGVNRGQQRPKGLIGATSNSSVWQYHKAAIGSKSARKKRGLFAL